MNYLKDSYTSDSGDIVFVATKSEFDASQQKIAYLEKVLKELESNNQTLKKNNIQKDKDYQLLIEDLDKLRKIIQEKFTQRETFKLQKQFKNMEEKILEQERQIKLLNEQNKILSDENLQLQNLKNDLLNKNSEIAEEKENFFKSYCSNKSQLQELGQQKIIYEDELNKYKKQIQRLEEENETLKQEKIEQEQQILQQRRLSFQYQIEAEKKQEILKQNQLIKDQPNQDECKRKINQSLITIQEEIIGRIQTIEKELKNNQNKKTLEREGIVRILNQYFNFYLRLPLEKHDITFKHDFRDNQIAD
ncbi:unnamed protein product [Paramecium sonneborni]|uniref:Uncharacterized protein n=1 Tax=Paramecium sonneborni TaxID=65129 RepID=A0A8S1K0L6_9CILI|nr:unnamed protein product [Paramecium sonneborni]